LPALRAWLSALDLGTPERQEPSAVALVTKLHMEIVEKHGGF